MSNLLEKASIITTPTAYSNGKLHSVKPVKTETSYNVNNTDFTVDGTSGAIYYKDTLSPSGTSGVATITFNHTILQGSRSRVYIRNGADNNYITTYTTSDFSQGQSLPNLTTQGDISVVVTFTDGLLFGFLAENGNEIQIQNFQAVEITDADFDFQRGSAATRVNSQGLIENVQTLSGNLVQNGDFSEIGSELVTNGSFDTDSDWNTEGTPSFSIANGVLNCFSDGAYAGISQNIVLEQGKTYKLEFDIVRIGENSGTLNFGDQTSYILLGFVSTNDDLGKKTIYFKPERTTTTIRIYRSSACDIDLDNVSVKEVGQNWEFGTGWSMRDGKAVSDGSANNSIKQVISFNPSVLKIKFDVSDLTQGSVRLFVNTPTFTQLINAGSNGSYETTVEVTSGANNIFFYSTNNFIGSIDNISVIEITDDTDLPRIDYTDGCGSLLLEPQSTNLIEYSEDFSDGSWNKQSNITPTYNTTETLSPDGTYNATKLIGNGSNGIYAQVSVTGIVSRSVYLKSVTGTVNVLIKDPMLTVTQKTLSVNESWQRFELVESNGHGSTSGIWIDDIPSSGIYIWGVQLEQQSYPTSYIPTNGSTATRLADVCNNAGSSDLINSTEGVLYAEVDFSPQDNRSIVIKSNTSDRLSISSRPNNGIRFFISDSGGLKYNDYSNALIDGFNKIALSWDADGFYGFVNGSKIHNISTAINLQGLNQVSFESGLDDFYGNVKSVVVFKEALTNDELEGLTGEGYDTFNALALANNYTII